MDVVDAVGGHVGVAVNLQQTGQIKRRPTLWGDVEKAITIKRFIIFLNLATIHSADNVICMADSCGRGDILIPSKKVIISRALCAQNPGESGGECDWRAKGGRGEAG